MDSADDVEMVNGKYDIFENSSPQRPITSHGDVVPSDTVDQVLSNNNHVVNFSRKRGPQDGRTPHEQSIEHGSKRHRHAQWPEKPDTKENILPADAAVLSPARPSKFKEGSMNDKPSAKPPSMFTRHMDQYVNLADEQLMGEYHIEQDKPLPPNPSMYSLHRLSRSPERKRASTQVAASTFSLDTQDEKAGGIFRFGKSMASAFNPLNVWSRFTTGWRAAKEELVEEAEDARKKKAEEAYATMKQEGKLGGLSSNAFSNAPVFTPGYTQAAGKSENQRDSGISMATTTRPSIDSSNRGSFLDTEASPKKSRRHGRTPSFHDLKKVASTINLHRRSASSSRSPAKEDINPNKTQTERVPRSRSRGNVLEFFGDNIGSLRNSRSKNNLIEEYDDFGNRISRKEQAKQVKLTKRVSDLEAKLDSARRELDLALGNVPPVPAVPPQLNRQPMPRFQRNADGSQGSFVPALETVLSESLLIPPAAESCAMIADGARTVATANVLHDELVSVVDTEAADPVVQKTIDACTNYLHKHKNEQLLKGDITNTPQPTTPEHDGNKYLTVVFKTTSDPATSQDQTFLQETSSPAIGSANKASGGSSKKKKKRNSVGRSKVDRTYRPNSESSVDTDAGWKDVRKSRAKKRKSGENLNNHESKQTKPSRLPASPQLNKSGTGAQQHKVLRKPVSFKTLPPTPLDMAATERSSLDLDPVPEDAEIGAGVSFTSIVPAKTGPPRKPTAKATPAIYHDNHATYCSPTSGSPEPFPRTFSSPVREREYHRTSFGSPKRKRKVLTPKRDKGKEERSKSPPVSSGRVKGGKGSLRAMEGDRGGDLVVKRPNGRDVPEMPGMGGKKLESKSSFEWDEEVF